MRVTVLRQLTTLLRAFNTVGRGSLAVAPKTVRLLVVTVPLCAVPNPWGDGSSVRFL
jgi:hypothetical protein